MEESIGGAGLVAAVTLADSGSGERDGTVTECMEESPEGLSMCRGLSHPTSTLECCGDGHPAVRAGDPQIPGGCWWHLAEARLGCVPTC